MNTLTSIDVSKARNNFFNLVEDVHLNGTAFLVKKAGIPVAEIRRPMSNLTSNIMSFAGALRGIDAKKHIRTIYEARSDKNGVKRHIPILT